MEIKFTSNRKGRANQPTILRVSTLKRPSEKRLATTASGKIGQYEFDRIWTIWTCGESNYQVKSTWYMSLWLWLAYPKIFLVI